jgi:hypothetical protein
MLGAAAEAKIPVMTRFASDPPPRDPRVYEFYKAWRYNYPGFWEVPSLQENSRRHDSACPTFGKSLVLQVLSGGFSVNGIGRPYRRRRS